MRAKVKKKEGEMSFPFINLWKQKQGKNKGLYEGQWNKERETDRCQQDQADCQRSSTKRMFL